MGTSSRTPADTHDVASAYDRNKPAGWNGCLRHPHPVHCLHPEADPGEGPAVAQVVFLTEKCPYQAAIPTLKRRKSM